jgi:hypothetical protein
MPFVFTNEPSSYTAETMYRLLLIIHTESIDTSLDSKDAVYTVSAAENIRMPMIGLRATGYTVSDDRAEFCVTVYRAVCDSVDFPDAPTVAKELYWFATHECGTDNCLPLEDWYLRAWMRVRHPTRPT